MCAVWSADALIPLPRCKGRGVKKLRDAGIEVTVGVLEKECLALNKRFITFNTHHRPYILLKWAQSADGFISGEGGRQVALSSPFTQMLVHKLRAENDAILVGRRTLDGDHPRLNVRLWAGRDPERLVLTHHREGVPEGFRAFDDINSVLEYLYSEGKQSLIVEGGLPDFAGISRPRIVGRATRGDSSRHARCRSACATVA